MTRDLRSITMASPKLFAMNATRWLSGEMSARSPKCVSTSMFEGKCCSGSSGDLCPKGSIKQEVRMTARVRTGKSYHRRRTSKPAMDLFSLQLLGDFQHRPYAVPIPGRAVDFQQLLHLRPRQLGFARSVGKINLQFAALK